MTAPDQDQDRTPGLHIIIKDIEAHPLTGIPEEDTTTGEETIDPDQDHLDGTTTTVLMEATNMINTINFNYCYIHNLC